MPMLASTFRARPPTLNGSLSASWIRCAAPATESFACTCGRSIANSSPPRRATWSPSRSTVRRRLPTRSMHQVAVEVPERVVDLLEAVEVHQQHRHHRAVRAVGKRAVGQGTEELAVGQPGQRVDHAGLGVMAMAAPGPPLPGGRDQPEEHCGQEQAHRQQKRFVSSAGSAGGHTLERIEWRVGVQDPDGGRRGRTAYRRVDTDGGSAQRPLLVSGGVAGEGAVQARGRGQLAAVLALDAGVHHAAAAVQQADRQGVALGGHALQRARDARAVGAAGLTCGHRTGQCGLPECAAHDLGLGLGGPSGPGVAVARAAGTDRQDDHRGRSQHEPDRQRDRGEAVPRGGHPSPNRPDGRGT